MVNLKVQEIIAFDKNRLSAIISDWQHYDVSNILFAYAEIKRRNCYFSKIDKWKLKEFAEKNEIENLDDSVFDLIKKEGFNSYDDFFRVNKTIIPVNSDENHKLVRNNAGYNYIRYVIIIAIGLLITLPFHYVPQQLMVFPKDHFTFEYTIITQEDIEKIIERYNKSNFMEKAAMNNEEIVRKLKEHGLIVDKDKDN